MLSFSHSVEFDRRSSSKEIDNSFGYLMILTPPYTPHAPLITFLRVHSINRAVLKYNFYTNTRNMVCGLKIYLEVTGNCCIPNRIAVAAI